MFRYEKEMIPIIEKGFLNKFNNINIAREFRTGNGVSDITVAQLNNDIVPFKLNDYTEMYYLVKYLHRKGGVIEHEILIKNNNLNKDTMHNLLDRLLEHGYLQRKNNGYKVNKKYESPVDKIYSVEAKLTKWKDAFYQALRYKCFSHKTYVALPLSKCKNVNLNLFREYNIGLIAVLKDSTEIIFKPKMEQPSDKVAFFHLAEKLF